MFKRVSLQGQQLRRRYSQALHVGRMRSRVLREYPVIVVSAAVATAGVIWYSSGQTIHNDVAPSQAVPVAKATPTFSTGLNEDGSLTAVVWGSNKFNIIYPRSPGVDTVRNPSAANWLQNVALRDLALHNKHAACVDAKGDVYQWGDGFFGSSPYSDEEARDRYPSLTLCGKDIVHLQLTESRVFALSASGKIFTLAASAAEQKPREPAHRDNSWWNFGWLVGQSSNSADFAEILPKEKLGWGETFVSMSAGKDHLLALTSSGRAFAHPINKNSNSHGQLGFRKFDIPSPSVLGSSNFSERLPVELIPKSIADPFAKTSPYSRTPSTSTSPPTSTVSENLQLINDQHIRFSDTLFEIPSLNGIKISRIAAGSRSSYVLTDSGRALGWGANDYGQIGLGDNVTLDTITIPTEIVLWRNLQMSLTTKCLDIFAGGDLTCFVVGRSSEKLNFVDVLTCGNGQWGGLGNNIYSNAQANPSRAKNVSGLREYNEQSQSLQPISPHSISVSPMGHVLLTLDTSGSGRDLMVWGINHDYQLGNGKRTSLPVPTALEKLDGTRFSLMTKKSTVNDLTGRLWRKNVDVEQCAVAGYGNSIVYWKIC